MPNMIIDNRTISWSLNYSTRRRTVRLHVVSADQLEITAPKGFSLSHAKTMLQRKTAWILRQILRLEAVAANTANASLTHGATLLFRGVPHALLLLGDGRDRPHVTCHQRSISVHLPELIGENNNPAVASSIQNWYLAEATLQLQERTQYWAAQIGVKPKKLSLRDQKTRWGSCSSRGSISYNWRLIMAPPEVLDYLVIHELCHLLHPNHSTAYWQEVGRWCPDYRAHRRWLRLNGTLLGKIFAN